MAHQVRHLNKTYIQLTAKVLYLQEKWEGEYRTVFVVYIKEFPGIY
jgi:hypothetical protein